jgi:DNA-binding response OmpR family regulator
MIKGRIHFLEDNMDIYELVQFFMKHNGYEVFPAVIGRDAADAAIKQKPNLMLMDLGIPDRVWLGCLQADQIQPDYKKYSHYCSFSACFG